MKKIAGFCLLWLALASAGAGRDIFVNNLGGDDRFTGREPRNLTVGEGPVQTFSKALRLACVGDRIVLAATGKPYRESVSVSGMRLSGASGRLLVIAGNGAVLDGTAPIPVEAWRHIGGGVYRFRPPHTGFQQLFLDDAPLLRSTAASHACATPKTSGKAVAARQRRHPLPRRAGKDAGGLPPQLRRAADRDHVVSGRRRDDRGLDRAGIPSGRHCGRQRREEHHAPLGRRVETTAATASPWAGRARSRWIPARPAATALPNSSPTNYSETHLRDCRLLGDTAPGWVDSGGRVYLGDTLARRAGGSR